MSDDRRQRMVWIDLEMTGLIPETCTILEIATVVTDAHLNVLAHGPNLAIHQPDAVLEAMDQWNTTHHGASGLTQRVKDSTVSMQEAQAQTLTFLKQHVDQGKAPLCGNSIGQDRMFLRLYMPKLEDYLYYRNVDVSSIKELLLRWYPESYLPPRKKSTHLALEDILESIDELKYYRERIFLPPEQA